MANITVPEPFPIFLSGGHYLLYDINTITYARRVHNICGVLIGTIPHISQQNVFSGVPLELMPEEARILVEHEHAYIVDDVKAHDAMLTLGPEERAAFRAVLEKQGREASQSSQKRASKRKEEFFRRTENGKKGGVSSGVSTPSKQTKKEKQLEDSPAEYDSSNHAAVEEDADSSLFAPSTPSSSSPATKMGTPSKVGRFHITPATSYPPMEYAPLSEAMPLPEVPHSYPLFAYLHSKGFFMSPGLRFGCQYCVYPGDPLRYHSHFLAVGKQWREDFNLMQIVGGGRLGTAVKKAFLIGGAKPREGTSELPDPLGNARDVRAFSIEWAGM